MSKTLSLSRCNLRVNKGAYLRGGKNESFVLDNSTKLFGDYLSKSSSKWAVSHLKLGTKQRIYFFSNSNT
jgi:hypothetical protein